MSLSWNIWNQISFTVYTHISANWSYWEIDSLEIVIVYDFDSTGVWSYELECSPLIFGEIFDCSSLFVKPFSCTFHAIRQRMHQNIYFKCFSNGWFKWKLFKTFINLINTDFLNLYLIPLLEQALSEFSVNSQHPLFHNLLIKTKHHSGNDIHVDFSFKERS